MRKITDFWIFHCSIGPRVNRGSFCHRTIASHFLSRRYTPVAMLVFHLILMLVLAMPQVAGAQEATAAKAAGVNSPKKHSLAEIRQLIDRANAGDPKAQFALGEAYADGNGVAQSFELALKWYHQAADQGNADADNALGIMYRTGSGVEQSKEQAVAWYREAARRGNGLAMFNLATAYYNGDGLNVDDVAAYAWFTLAKEAGARNAIDAVARMDAELRPYMISAALRTIAEMYAKGGEVKQDDATSIRWYRQAAERGDKDAQVNLGEALIAGRGTPANYAEGRKWCEAAAKQRSDAGEACLGLIYRGGLGVEKNPKQAIQHFTQAADWNNTLALRTLGEMYESGEAGKTDRVEAFMRYLRAALAGDKESLSRAASMKATMSASEWDQAQKRMREWRMDPQKVEAFLGSGGG